MSKISFEWFFAKDYFEVKSWNSKLWFAEIKPVEIFPYMYTDRSCLVKVKLFSVLINDNSVIYPGQYL